MSIQNECFTVSMQVGVWVGQRLDKEATAKVTKEASAHSDAARVNKHVVPKESFSGITTRVSALRGYLYANTLPWKDNGDRLVTRKLFQKFMNGYEELRGLFYEEVEKFLSVRYPTALDQAEFRMGDLFNEDDYPSPSKLRQKFYVTLDIDGVSTAYDFRLQTDESIIQARITKAVEGLWEKLSKPLEHFATKMGDKDCIFRDTTVSNLRDIVEILPALNFTGDANLEALGERISKNLAGYDAKDLRGNAVTRAAVASEAADILASMQGFMRSFTTTGGNDDQS